MKEIYVDGSCSGNPGPGGWAGILIDTDMDQILEIAVDREIRTTNNRMEMKAILWALKNYGRHIPPLIVHSDSSYAINTFTQWMWSWKRNGWKRAGNKSIENFDLVQEYDELVQQGMRIDLRKVDGHTGVKYNELADKLAKGIIKAEDVTNFE